MTAPSTDTPIDIQALQALLQGDTFAPWVRELALRVEQATPTEVVLALPIAPIHVHGGGVLCGQTVMAAADTAITEIVSPLTRSVGSSVCRRPPTLQDKHRVGWPVSVSAVQCVGGRRHKALGRAINSMV